MTVGLASDSVANEVMQSARRIRRSGQDRRLQPETGEPLERLVNLREVEGLSNKGVRAETVGDLHVARIRGPTPDNDRNGLQNIVLLYPGEHLLAVAPVECEIQQDDFRGWLRVALVRSPPIKKIEGVVGI